MAKIATEISTKSTISITCQGADSLPIDILQDFQGGIKRITTQNLQRLKSRILRRGINVPVFVWRHNGDNYILDGHQRIKALCALHKDGYDLPLIPVAYIEAESRRDAKDALLGIASQYGEYVLEDLLEFTADLEITTDLRLMDGEMLLFNGKARPETEGDDDVPEDAPSITTMGDLWELGAHRLLCGDSTKAEDVGRVLDGSAPFLMVTDPPYGVNYNPQWRNEEASKGHLAYAPTRVGIVINDDCVDWSPAWALFPGQVAYCWHAGRVASIVQTGLESVGFEIRAQIIWAKSHFPISRGHYHWRHEPCWYCVRHGAKAKWAGDRKQTTLWEINLDRNVDGGHSTQKPVECMARPIRNHGGPGDDIYDPFLGSGTTLIAAEQSGRRCRAIEINPAYVDIAVHRWNKWCLRNNRMPDIRLNGKSWEAA